MLKTIDDKRIMDCPRIIFLHRLKIRGQPERNYDDIWKHN